MNFEDRRDCICTITMQSKDGKSVSREEHQLLKEEFKCFLKSLNIFPDQNCDFTDIKNSLMIVAFSCEQHFKKQIEMFVFARLQLNKKYDLNFSFNAVNDEVSKSIWGRKASECLIHDDWLLYRPEAV